jgi:poly(A) polymerase
MNTLKNLPINENPAALAARDVIERIQREGHQAYIVGGGVRDLIMGRKPQDLDVATSATPGVLSQLFPDSMMVGAKFGVILVHQDGHPIEVATFREEGEYHDRRRPDLVRFSTHENDAIRRDFTANALYYDPVTEQLLDVCGGLSDINNKVLRAVGNPSRRFYEDALRIIRGVRFAANLQFEVESNTWEALRDAAPLLLEISIERVRDELIKGLIGGNPARFLDLLDSSGILNLVWPEVVRMKGCEQPPEFHPEGDVFVHTRLLLKHLKPDPSPELALAVLLHDTGKPETQTFEDRIRFNGHDKVGARIAKNVCRRLRCSNLQTEKVATMVRRHMQFVNVPNMKTSTLNRFLAEPTITDELELHRCDCLASHGSLSTYVLVSEKLKLFNENEHFKGDLPVPLVNGKDLISLGMHPGPLFSVLLRELMDAQMDNRICSKEEGLAFAQQWLAAGNRS